MARGGWIVLRVFVDCYAGTGSDDTAMGLQGIHEGGGAARHIRHIRQEEREATNARPLPTPWGLALGAGCINLYAHTTELSRSRRCMEIHARFKQQNCNP